MLHSKRARVGAVIVPVLLAILAVAIAAEQTSCTKNGEFKWPEATKCLSDIGDLVGTISRILISDLGDGELSPAGKQQLGDLAKQYGASKVLCIVDRLFKEWTAPGATATPERTKAAARADEFLRSTGTRIEN